MLVAQALRLLLRRWRVVLLTFAVALLAAAGAATQIPPSYQTQTSLLFLSPATVPSGDGDGVTRRINPFVNFSQDLFVARDVVSARLAGDDVAAQLERAGLTGTYTIAPAIEGAAPILVVTVTADDPTAATFSAKLLSDRVQAELEAQQKAAQAPASSYITSTVITPPQDPEVVRKAQLQAALVVLAGCVVLGLLVIAADERRRIRPTARKARTDGPWADGPQPVADQAGWSLAPGTPRPSFDVDRPPARPREVPGRPGAQEPDPAVRSWPGPDPRQAPDRLPRPVTSAVTDEPAPGGQSQWQPPAGRPGPSRPGSSGS